MIPSLAAGRMHGLAGFNHFIRVPLFVQIEISGKCDLLLDEVALPEDYVGRDETCEQGRKSGRGTPLALYRADHQCDQEGERQYSEKEFNSYYLY